MYLWYLGTNLTQHKNHTIKNIIIEIMHNITSDQLHIKKTRM